MGIIPEDINTLGRLFRNTYIQFDNIYNDLDFCWNNPTAIKKIHLDKNRKKIYVFDEVYQQYMSDSVLLTTVKTFTNGNQQYITCDDANPKTIDFLNNNNVRAIPTIKGADSIMRGIRWLQDYIPFFTYT